MALIQQLQKRTRLLRVTAAATILLIFATGMSFALSPAEEDARSFSMEVAAPYLSQGFKLRAERWSGEISSGEKTPVKFQLFKGNEYWFWTGASEEKSTVKVNVYDSSGKSIAVEKIKRKKGMGGVRVKPQKTGTYVVVVTISSRRAAAAREKIGWALAYGYR
ncbi:MAG: hypothetical protein ACI9R3_001191 [Verrucomicrobiales bacterium]|jgi:hypothetical protein